MAFVSRGCCFSSSPVSPLRARAACGPRSRGISWRASFCACVRLLGRLGIARRNALNSDGERFFRLRRKYERYKSGRPSGIIPAGSRGRRGGGTADGTGVRRTNSPEISPQRRRSRGLPDRRGQGTGREMRGSLRAQRATWGGCDARVVREVSRAARAQQAIAGRGRNDPPPCKKRRHEPVIARGRRLDNISGLAAVAAAQAGGFVLTIHSPASGDLKDVVLVAEAHYCSPAGRVARRVLAKTSCKSPITPRSPFTSSAVILSTRSRSSAFALPCWPARTESVISLLAGISGSHEVGKRAQPLRAAGESNGGLVVRGCDAISAGTEQRTCTAATTLWLRGISRPPAKNWLRTTSNRRRSCGG